MGRSSNSKPQRRAGRPGARYRLSAPGVRLELSGPGPAAGIDQARAGQMPWLLAPQRELSLERLAHELRKVDSPVRPDPVRSLEQLLSHLDHHPLHRASNVRTAVVSVQTGRRISFVHEPSCCAGARKEVKPGNISSGSLPKPVCWEICAAMSESWAPATACSAGDRSRQTSTISASSWTMPPTKRSKRCRLASWLEGVFFGPGEAHTVPIVPSRVRTSRRIWFSGGGGIRTPGPLRVGCFPGSCIQPDSATPPGVLARVIGDRRARESRDGDRRSVVYADR